MKEHLRDLVAGAGSSVSGGGLAREYLQARVLESLQDTGTFLRWAFLGGTALRFLYSLPRFSEDLDFSVIDAAAQPGLGSALTETKRAFVREGYRVEVRVDDRRAVASAWIRFPGLPHELGLSPHPSQVLSIKVEVDTRPPPGAGITTSLVRRHVTLNLCHYDRASLLAGKLHALLSRPWTKGRDVYDLVWYLADRQWPAPNLALLNAALAQTRWGGPAMTAANWRKELRKRLEALDFARVRADVAAFLERPQDVALLSRENLARLLAD